MPEESNKTPIGALNLHKDPTQDYEANERHDRKYGWDYSLPGVYTNNGRNPEADTACPKEILAKAEDEETMTQLIWDWINRKRNDESVLALPQSA